MMKTVAVIASLLASASAFTAAPAFARVSSTLQATIAEGVEFDTVAREWRCKWDGEDEDKKSLVELQKVLDKYVGDIKAVEGVTNVERIVCGGCLDFKVITSLTAEKFGDWEGKDFAPEASFIEDMKAIDGVTFVETQTYTKMPV